MLTDKATKTKRCQTLRIKLGESRKNTDMEKIEKQRCLH